jgi:hypothetical protein
VFGIPEWAIGVVVIVIAVSIARALSGVVRGAGAAGRALVGGTSNSELARQREALEEVQHRLGELEERLDFAERLLTKQREGERLAPPPPRSETR